MEYLQNLQNSQQIKKDESDFERRLSFTLSPQLNTKFNNLEKEIDTLLTRHITNETLSR